MISNKYVGSQFEREICEILAKNGFWVHFISPDKRGAQPFDVIAVKNGIAWAIDCKTCEDYIFRINRLEENQKFAFEKWIRCGNENAILLVKHKDKVYAVEYLTLKDAEKIDLRNEVAWCSL